MVDVGVDFYHYIIVVQMYFASGNTDLEFEKKKIHTLYICIVCTFENISIRSLFEHFRRDPVKFAHIEPRGSLSGNTTKYSSRGLIIRLAIMLAEEF